MRLAGGHLLVVLLVLLILPDVSGAGEPCSRRCGRLVVPYPFGFSSTCPIKFSCDELNSTASLILPSASAAAGNATTAAADQSPPYSVVKFNPATRNSTFVVSVPVACGRSVAGARRWLAGANYGVSSRTGIFLRGCRNSTTANCSVPVEAMLRTISCGGGAESPAPPLTCIASISSSPNSTAAFVEWGKVKEPMCDNLMTSAYGETSPEGIFSLEFAMADMGWWVNGSCGGGGAAGDGGQCAANAACREVRTPNGGGIGHRCECLPGMIGDGFAAGDGCYFPGECSRSILSKAKLFRWSWVSGALFKACHVSASRESRGCGVRSITRGLSQS
uniref:Wall-associated receptor kinase galacturonan-binding domain-containing protein n=1 Tax=Leersia perrieri TaxID=77586 RepID=A0A0D9Y133_9ORYZ